MKCEGFELIWNTLSLSKLKEITRSRFTWRVGTEKRSRTPLFLYNFQHDTPLRIDCISNMLNLHFLPTGKNIVHKSSICPPTWLPFLKLCIQSSLQVFPCMVNGLIQFTWQSRLFTGNPPWSSSSIPVNSKIPPSSWPNFDAKFPPHKSLRTWKSEVLQGIDMTLNQSLQRHRMDHI